MKINKNTSHIDVRSTDGLIFSFRYKELSIAAIEAAIDEYYRAKEFGRNKTVLFDKQPVNDFDGVDVIYLD